MKNAPEVSNALRTQHDVRALPRLRAEWNMNRYFDTTVSNVISETEFGFDQELFPLDSIILPLRPTKGISRALTNHSAISDSYHVSGSPRFYIASAGDRYKYWVSPEISDSAGYISDCRPQVLYSESVQINKIRVTFENTWASPSQFTVQVTTDGSSWSTVATNPSINNAGEVILYWNGTGWSSTRPSSTAALRSIRGVRVSVTRLGAGKDVHGNTTTYRTATGWSSTTGAFSLLSVIEVAGTREVDLSDRVITVSDKQSGGETSQITPIGTLTTNDGTITLWNGDNLFSEDNEAGPYYGLLDANVEMNLEYVYYINGNTYNVQQFKMFSDDWSGQTDATVNVSVSDMSKFLKGLYVPEMLYEGMTVNQIIYRVCDSVGFNNFAIDANDALVDFTIPIFYADGKQNLLEVLDEIAKASQSLIYFDAYGTLRIKTRQAAFDMTSPIDWTLLGQVDGTSLPDIISLSNNEEFGSNVVKVRYQATRWSDWNNGMPLMQTVWEPEGTVTLRAVGLSKPIGTGIEKMYIPVGAVKTWLFSGIVNVEGELIRYEGKEYIHYKTVDGVSVRTTTMAKDADHQKQLDAETPASVRHKNAFTGALNVTERGVWNTMVQAHGSQDSQYDIRRYVNGNLNTGNAGYSPNKNRSTITLGPAGNLKEPSDRLYFTRGQSSGVGYIKYGFKFKFEKGDEYKHKRVGMVFHNQVFNEDGYYVEFTASSTLGGEERENRNELMFYTRKNGNMKAIGGKKDKGVALAIANGVEYEVDIYFKTAGSNHQIQVWVDGKLRLTVTVSGGNKNDKTDRFGFYIRGKTMATFEYLYAINRPIPEPSDDVTFLNKIDGSYYGQMAERDIPFDWNYQSGIVRKASVKQQAKKNRYVFDDFGPIAHEVREYDVKFSTAPVTNARLYMSNDWSAVCPEFNSTAFGAKFVLANTVRRNAVISGEETVGRAVNHILNVIARPLVVDDEEEVEVRNEGQIRRRGEIQTEFSNKWIQTKAAAEILAEWIDDHWSTGVDDQTAVVFGNPLFEVGDILEVDYQAKNISAGEHRYFVTAVDTSFQQGISTTLTLRRIPV